MSKKKGVSSSKPIVKKDGIDVRFILETYQYLKPFYHLPSLENFTLSILNLLLQTRKTKTICTKTGFELIIPLRYVIKSLGLAPRI